MAHPDLVEVARAPFDEALDSRPHQRERQREEVEVSAAQLLDTGVTDGRITEQGLRNNVSVGIQYLSSWLTGTGAAAIFNLMEDAATCEIARSQVWQWIQHGAKLDDGTAVDRELVERIRQEELAKIREAVGEEAYAKSRPEEAVALFEKVSITDEFVEFLTLPAYDLID